MAACLVLLRHGQSEWNQKNLFTGWHDVELSAKGEEEAKTAGFLLKNIKFDVVFASKLKRAINTAKLALGDRLPTLICSEALNERSYGELSGQNKDEMRNRYGAEKVETWRRSFSERPPMGESLADTCDRVLPYFEQEILPRLREGQNVLVAAHGNSLRALIKYLENLSEQEIVKVEVPTGVPIVYELDDQLHIIRKTVLKP